MDNMLATTSEAISCDIDGIFHVGPIKGSGATFTAIHDGAFPPHAAYRLYRNSTHYQFIQYDLGLVGYIHVDTALGNAITQAVARFTAPDARAISFLVQAYLTELIIPPVLSAIDSKLLLRLMQRAMQQARISSAQETKRAIRQALGIP